MKRERKKNSGSDVPSEIDRHMRISFASKVGQVRRIFNNKHQ